MIIETYTFTATETKSLLQKWQVDCRLPTAGKKLYIGWAGHKNTAEIEKVRGKNQYIITINNHYPLTLPQQ